MARITQPAPSLSDNVAAGVNFGEAAGAGVGVAGSRDDHVHEGPALTEILRQIGADTVVRTTSSITLANLGQIGSISIPAAVPFIVEFAWRKTGTAGNAFVGLQLNATDLSTTGVALYGGTNAETGFGRIYVAPRVTNYLRANAVDIFSYNITTNVPTDHVHTVLTDADAPTVAITTVTVRGRVGNAADTLETVEARVYALPTTTPP